MKNSNQKAVKSLFYSVLATGILSLSSLTAIADDDYEYDGVEQPEIDSESSEYESESDNDVEYENDYESEDD